MNRKESLSAVNIAIRKNFIDFFLLLFPIIQFNDITEETTTFLGTQGGTLWQIVKWGEIFNCWTRSRRNSDANKFIHVEINIK